MITTTDIANIIYGDCESFGITAYQNGNIPEGIVSEERIVILVKRQHSEKYWEKCFVEVNLCAPDLKGNADLIRLNELERSAKQKFKSKTFVFDNTTYTYSLSEIGIEDDSEHKCHFVNIKLLFESLNTL